MRLEIRRVERLAGGSAQQVVEAEQAALPCTFAAQPADQRREIAPASAASSPGTSRRAAAMSCAAAIAPSV